MFHPLLKSILDLVFPKKCLGCGKIGIYLCPSCLKTIPRNQSAICYRCQRPAISGLTHPYCHIRSGLDGILVVSPYSPILRKALHTFKYRYVEELGELLGSLLVDYLEGKLYPTDVIIPVPLHSKRLRQREFNQSLRLAEKVGEKFNLPVRPDLLIRKIATPSQAELSKAQRRENLKGAFACPKESDIKGKRILLIDDVATTFTTLEQCCLTLKKAGAAKVWAAVLAHGK